MNKTSQFLPLVITLLFFLNSCTSNSDSASSKQQTIRGVAQLGRIVRAGVSAFNLEGEKIADGRTNENGEFEISIPEGVPYFTIEVSGGTYLDEYTGLERPNRMISAIGVSGTTEIAVTAFSHLIKERVKMAIKAQTETALTKNDSSVSVTSSPEELINAARVEIAGIFALSIESLQDLPSDPRKLVDVTLPAGQVALVLGTLSSYLNYIAPGEEDDAFAMLAADYANDGALNGVVDVAFEGKVKGTFNSSSVSTETMSLVSPHFATGMQTAFSRFLNNPQANMFAGAIGLPVPQFANAPAVPPAMAQLFPPALGAVMKAVCTSQVSLNGTCTIPPPPPFGGCHPGCAPGTVLAAVAPAQICPFQPTLFPYSVASRFCLCGNGICDVGYGETIANCPAQVGQLVADCAGIQPGVPMCVSSVAGKGACKIPGGVGACASGCAYVIGSGVGLNDCLANAPPPAPAYGDASEFCLCGNLICNAAHGENNGNCPGDCP